MDTAPKLAAGPARRPAALLVEAADELDRLSWTASAWRSMHAFG